MPILKFVYLHLQALCSEISSQPGDSADSGAIPRRDLRFYSSTLKNKQRNKQRNIQHTHTAVLRIWDGIVSASGWWTSLFFSCLLFFLMARVISKFWVWVFISTTVNTVLVLLCFSQTLLNNFKRIRTLSCLFFLGDRSPEALLLL